MYEAEIDEAIKQLQAGSTRAPADLTLIACTPACTLEQYNLIASAIYTILDDTHLQISKRDKSPPAQQVVCLTSLASIITKRHVYSGMHDTLPTLVLHWVELYQWILYLKADFVDQESVELSFRLLAKRSIVDFLGVCNESFLRHMFNSIVSSPGIIPTLFSLWRLETRDTRFSLPVDMSHPMFHTQATLDSWMCAFSQRERWDWSEILHPFGGEADALATTALDRLQQDVIRIPINYDLVIWDIHLITTLSINEVIRISFLRQHSMTIITNVIASVVDQYAITNQHSLVAKYISYGYWYIRAYVESTEGLPWVTQLVEAGLLSTMLSTEPWIKHLNGQDSEDWDPLFILLKRIIPKYSMYSSALRPMVKRLTAIDTSGLPEKLDQGGLLFKSWSAFHTVVQSRAALYDLAISNEPHIVSCQNTKCGKSGPPGCLKNCARCLHVHYCSKECQVYDWKNGDHQKYCRDVQAYCASGFVSRLSKRDVRFIDQVIAQDLGFFRDRIQGAAMTMDLNPVVVELDYTEIPVQVDIGTVHTMPPVSKCPYNLPLAEKWSRMVELVQRPASKKILVRAVLPGGTSEKVKFQYLPLERVLGDHTLTTDEELMSELDETCHLLFARAEQSFDAVGTAFPDGMGEKAGVEGRKH